MDLYTIDFETHYGGDYTLSKMTTEAYVRDPRFEAIMVGIKRNDEPVQVFVGPAIEMALQCCDLPNNAALFHHAHFDAFILSHHYNIRPKIIFDTLAMARAEVGSVVTRSYSLGSLVKHFGLPDKGTEVQNAIGKRLSDFSAEELAHYKVYCGVDVVLARQLFDIMRPKFSTQELKLIDLTTRLFTEPLLELDAPLLEEYRQNVVAHKGYLMMKAGVIKQDLMSNDKFAGLLRKAGVEPGMKDSPTAKQEDGTPKRTYAFAKTDDFMKELSESDDEYLAALADARLGVKTSIAETRAQRFIGIQSRGSAPIYLRYWGAEQTGRHGGGDKTNFQNLGRSKALDEFDLVPGNVIITPEGRATLAKVSKDGTRVLTTAGEFKTKRCHRIGLRDALVAPPGQRLVVGDSSNIEARVICLLAGQEDVLQQFREGIDPYCALASEIFRREVTKADFMERQLGKVARLGLGFQMGKDKFYDTARKPPWNVEVERDLTDLAVDVFRFKNFKIVALWNHMGGAVLKAMRSGERIYADESKLLLAEKDGIRMPSGRVLRYPNIRQQRRPDSEWGDEWVFDAREGSRVMSKKIYGGFLSENCLAEGTAVLTDTGWVSIEQIRPHHKVHDGVDFVSHGGVVYKSVQPCVRVDGVAMTADHEVLTDEGWIAALEKPRPYRPDIRIPDRNASDRKRRKEDVVGVHLSVRGQNYKGRIRSNKGSEAGALAKLRLPDRGADDKGPGHPRDVLPPSVRGVEVYARSMQAAYTPVVAQLRRAWHNCVSALAEAVRELLGRHGTDIPARAGSGSAGQQQGVYPPELRVAIPQRELHEPKEFFGGRYCGDVQANRYSEIDLVLSACTRTSSLPVYDILDCGPRSRFVVRGTAGPFIVHNCTQAVARNVVMEQALVIAKYHRVVHLVHDEVVCCVPEKQADACERLMLEVMSTAPVWAPMLPVAAETGQGVIYGTAKG